MRHVALVGAVVGLAFLWPFSQVSAENGDQSPVADLWCDPDIATYDPAYPLAYETLGETTQALIEQGEWRKVDRRIATRFQQHSKEENLSGTEVTAFRAALTFYLTETVQKPERWRPEEAGGDKLKYELPIGTNLPSAAVRVDCNEIGSDKASAAIAYTAVALFRAGQTDLVTAMKIGAAKLDAVYQTHRNRLFNGFPMWPWETWINGLDIDFDTKDPAPAPRHQWIFLRPSLSPALKFDGNDDSELEAGFVIEPVGFVHYTKDDYSSWIGISPMVTITNSNGIGYGGLLRYGNWQLGAAYHDDDSDVLLYVSVDLYDYVVGKDKRTANANAFLKGLADNLSKKQMGEMPE